MEINTNNKDYSAHLSLVPRVASLNSILTHTTQSKSTHEETSGNSSEADRLQRHQYNKRLERAEEWLQISIMTAQSTIPDWIPPLRNYQQSKWNRNRDCRSDESPVWMGDCRIYMLQWDCVLALVKCVYSIKVWRAGYLYYLSNELYRKVIYQGIESYKANTGIIIKKKEDNMCSNECFLFFNFLPNKHIHTDM